MNNDLILKISKRVLAGILVFSIIFLLFLENPKPLVLGLFLGGIISIISFILIDKTLTNAIKLPGKQIKFYIMKHYIIRYVIYFVVIFIAAKADYLSIITTLLGLLSVKYTIILSNMFDRNFK